MQPTDTKAKIAHTFRLSPETLARIKAAAAEDLRSMNTTVEVAVRYWLAEREATAAGTIRTRPT